METRPVHTIAPQDFAGESFVTVLASGTAKAEGMSKRLELVAAGTADGDDLHLFYRIVRSYGGDKFDSTPRLATFASAFDTYNSF